MQQLLRICDSIDRFLQIIGKLASVLLLVLAGIIVFDVVTRGTTWANSTRLQELEWHFHAAICFFVFAFALVNDRHVRVELLRDNWSVRTRAVVEILGILFLFLPMVLVVLYFSIKFAQNAWVSGEASPSATGLSHRWIIKSCQPVGFALLLVAGLTRLNRQIHTLITGNVSLPPSNADI